MEESSEIKAKPQRQLLIATDGSESRRRSSGFRDRHG